MSEARVLWTAEAKGDLLRLVRWIAEEDRLRARDVLDRLEAAAAKLDRLPSRGRVVPELRALGVHRYRELIEGPWRIIYRVEEATVFVVFVVDSRRELANLLLERLTRLGN